MYIYNPKARILSSSNMKNFQSHAIKKKKESEKVFDIYHESKNNYSLCHRWNTKK